MRIFSVTVLILAGSIFCQPLCSSVFADDEFYVEIDGDNGNSGDSASDAWATIQYAIDHDDVSSGDTIYIGEGSFTETLVIDKGVTLQGEGADTIISAEDDAATMITISANHVSLEDIAVEGDTYTYGVYVEDDVYDLTIYGCDISEHDIGIYLDATDGVDISYCDFDYNSKGIYMDNADNGEITYNDFTENTTGMKIDASEIDSIYGNEFEGGNYGIYLVDDGDDYYTDDDADELEADNSFDDCEDANVYFGEEEEDSAGCFIGSLF